MIKSAKLFYYYLNDSLRELKNNFKIYLVYILSLCLVAVVQNGLDLTFPKDAIVLRIISKILFSIVPILILSKILYVIKIRHFGVGEYGRVLWRFLLYNFYYFFLVLVAASLYFFSAMIVGSMTTMETGALVTSFLLAPFFYVIIFYSLSPIVAVFYDEQFVDVFSQSRKLTRKNMFLVIVNHLISLLIPVIFSSILLVDNPILKFSLGLVLSVPEAIMSILMLLTTTRICLYLSELE